MKARIKQPTSTASDETPCSRILITLEITDHEVVEDYKNTSDDLVWDDLVNGELINFAEFVSRKNAKNAGDPPPKYSTEANQ